jgi:hypothetical protein
MSSTTKLKEQYLPEMASGLADFVLRRKTAINGHGWPQGDFEEAILYITSHPLVSW